MERLYLLLGQSSFLIKQQIGIYQAESKVDSFNVLTYDALETELNTILQELTTVSFFSDQKMIILENIEAFYRYDDQQLKPLINYFMKPSNEIILILTSQKLPPDHIIESTLMKYAYVENIQNLKASALPLYIKEIFNEDGYSIEAKAIEELINRVGEDLFLLHQEINKLKIYQVYDKVIDFKDVDVLVARTLEDNIFAFSTAYLSGDVKLYMQIYDDLLTNKMAPTQIMNHLFNTVNMIQLAQNLIKDNHNQDAIANYFKISSGRAYYLIKEAREQSPVKIEKLIKNLADLDYKIKSGQTEDKIGLELLLLGGIR